MNTEQDWLKTNLAKFSRMLQGQRDLVAVGHLILSELAPVVGAQRAEFYVLRYSQEQPRLRLMASYASDGHGAYSKSRPRPGPRRPGGLRQEEDHADLQHPRRPEDRLRD